MTLDAFFWLAAGSAFLVGLSKGGLPAVGMLSVPLLSLFMPPMAAAVLLLPIYVISDLVGVWLYRREFSAGNLRLLIPAGFAGVFFGWLTAAQVSPRILALLIGLLGIGFCVNAWRKRRIDSPPRPANRIAGLFWGALSGFTSFIAHAGAPPFQIHVVPQRLPKAVFAGTSTLFFAAINAAKILPYQLLQPYDSAQLGSAAVLVPFALVGTVAGAWLTKRIADAWFYRAVQAGLFAVSLKLVADALA